MSFLLDPILLIEAGAVIGERVESDRAAAVLGGATLAGFFGVSVPLYADAAWTKPIWKACGAKSGRDWMLNSGVFAFDFDKPAKRTHLISAVLFTTYPLWLAAGVAWGRMRRRKLRA